MMPLQIEQDHLDFSEIDHYDPSLGDGHRVLYDREIPAHIKYQDKYVEFRDMPNPEQLTVRILIIKGPDENPNSIKVELFCENDLFFAYFQDINTTSYSTLKLEQQLQYSFREYPKLCITSLNKCLDTNNNSKYSAQFIMMIDGSGKLEIVQSTEFKNIHMITINLMAYNNDYIRQRIQTKYSQVKTRINSLVKFKRSQQ